MAHNLALIVVPSCTHRAGHKLSSDTRSAANAKSFQQCKADVCRHPASGYVQGINDLVTPFLAVFLSAHLQGPLEDWQVCLKSQHVHTSDPASVIDLTYAMCLGAIIEFWELSISLLAVLPVSAHPACTCHMPLTSQIDGTALELALAQRPCAVRQPDDASQ